MRITILGALCALTTLVPVQARAEADPEAVRLFKEALTAYNAGEWAKAATGFMQAYQIEPEAIFMYNAAKARGALAGDDPARLKAALRLLQRARTQKERPLSDTLKAKAQKYDAELRSKIAALEERQRKILEAKYGRGQMSWVGWSGAGVMVLGASVWGVTLAQGVGVSQNIDRLALERDRAQYDAQRAQVEAAQQQGRTQLVVAWSLMALGAGVITWDLVTRGGVPWETPPGASVSVGPMGVSVQGRF